MSPELLIVASNSKNNDNITYDSDYSGNVLAEYNARLYGSECACVATSSASDFVPSDLAPLLWLDASDSSTLTLSGSLVNQWSDKSGNNNHATQTNSSYMPTYSSNILNNLNMVYFSRYKQLLGSTGEYRDLYLVLKNVRRFAMVFGNQNNDDSLRMIQYRFSPTPDSNDWHYNELDNLYVNGEQTYVISGTYYIVRSYRSNEVGFGSSFQYYLNSSFGNNGRYFGGYLGEVIAFSSAQSDDNRQKIEGYLAHKWGLTGNLSNTHPYYSEVPQSSSSNTDYLPEIAKQYCIK